MGERKTAADATIGEMLDRVARGVIVESALPVSPALDGLRRVEGEGAGEAAAGLKAAAAKPLPHDDAASAVVGEP